MEFSASGLYGKNTCHCSKIQRSSLQFMHFHVGNEGSESKLNLPFAIKSIAIETIDASGVTFFFSILRRRSITFWCLIILDEAMHKRFKCKYIGLRTFLLPYQAIDQLPSPFAILYTIHGSWWHMLQHLVSGLHAAMNEKVARQFRVCPFYIVHQWGNFKFQC